MEDSYSDADLRFLNKVLDKKQLKKLISWVFRNYGVARAANMADQLKTLGFHFATQAGISLSLEDLRIPPNKRNLLESMIRQINSIKIKFILESINAVRNKNLTHSKLKEKTKSIKYENLILFFKETDPLNPIYIMAFSGARGNVSQVRQLVGMRGLMADPQGQIIDLPIASNFREGLTVTEYFISSYGARKGLVDTALRTADSGYLTRRLVDVAQDVIIREIDCQTERGIILEEMVDNNKTLINLEQALVGRILAEDIFYPSNNKLIGQSVQHIDSNLAQKIINAGIKKVLVRSPLTCESHGSICQYCYGWNLAHGKIIDLGEAVGIIAAQSIGEPGTQLTMRTFHTGGVFTGELANQIYAPISGYINYPNKTDISQIRTSHGEEALLINAVMTIEIIKSSEEKKSLQLNKNDILFYKNKEYVEYNAIIGESPVSKRLSTEKAQKYLISDISGQIHFNELRIKETDRTQKDYISRIIENNGLIWILSGKVYNIPDMAELCVKEFEKINKGDILAKIKLINKFAGYVKIQERGSTEINYLKQISIITQSLEYKETKIIQEQKDGQEINVLYTNNNYKFELYINSKTTLNDYQTIGKLLSDEYKTNTGGIIKFLNLPVSKRKTGNAYEILGPGYIIWISEETHSIHKDISLLLVQNGEFIEEGTEICKNIFCKNCGTVEIIQKDEIVKEIIIKPGKIYNYEGKIEKKEKKRGFLRPGEKLYENLTTDKLVYWEHINYKEKPYLLIRPVTVFSITEKTFAITKEFSKSSEDSLGLQVVLRTPFKDGERIKSILGIDLLNIELISKIKIQNNLLVNEIEFPINQQNNSKYVKLSTVENLSFKESNINDYQGNYTNSRILVENDEYVAEETVIAQTEIMSQSDGVIDTIPSEFHNNRRIMILTETDNIPIKNGELRIELGEWIRAGDEIMSGITCMDSGKIINIDTNIITIRLARPYLVSSGSILYINDKDLVQRGETLAVLIFQRKKTGDIVQGLPRIEEILEARKKSDSPLNPHELLDELFIFYSLEGLNLHDAARLSLQDSTIRCLNEIQLVYQSQNVDIADKHVEVIVRQMTNKVRIENGGNSNYLPGELVDLYKIETINRTLQLNNSKLATYYPVLMGITKASLNTDSFISAASFQETTKVLTEAAIAGKLDWLKGLKENVIIGRLIPAGTGFNLYNNNQLY
uniref:DNA-directed RNA polymerase subunit beta'' n=1 Tax=Flintiella sanguinaria TaxID=101926 RepID=A0A1X9PU78_9RHOD|nr:plastid-encoded DNA-directed RNA polymerase [Flintiella sanguinaria]